MRSNALKISRLDAILLLTAFSMHPFIDQIALTVIAPIKAASRPLLDQTLATIQLKLETNPILPFKQIQGLHFARFVVLDDYLDQKGKRIPAQLIYSSNFDSSLNDHLKQITSPLVLMGFYQIFSYCEGFDSTIPPVNAVQGFVSRYQQPVNTFYRGHRGLSVRDINSENNVRTLIEQFLEKTPGNNVSARQLKEQIDQYINQQLPEWKPPTAVKLPSFTLLQTALLFVVLPLIATISVGFWVSCYLGWLILVLLGAFGGYLRYLEIRAKSLGDDDEDFGKITDLAANEDKIVQNQLTHLVPLQPGIFRRTLQQIALWILNKLAYYTFNKGRLGDIATIHFARWLLIDNGRRLIFFSNFDGSWENYLGDFVDRAAFGLTLAWSNTSEFPRTRWLVMDGATDEERFKTWTRKYQIQTAVWYSGYRDLTVKNILRNRAIAAGINQPLTDAQLVDWLKLL